MDNDMLCAEGGHLTMGQLAEHKARWAKMNVYELCEERKSLAANYGEKHLWAALYAEGEIELVPPETPMDRRYSTAMYEGERIDAQMLLRAFENAHPETNPNIYAGEV